MHWINLVHFLFWHKYDGGIKMIMVLSVLLVIAIGAFYAGYRTGYSAGYVDHKQDAPIDWDKWTNA